MILLRSTHLALLAEKDARIAHLLSEVGFLRECVRPPAKESGRASFITTAEANAVLDGKQEQQLFSAPAPSLEDEAVAIAVAAEAASLFTGNY